MNIINRIIMFLVFGCVRCFDSLCTKCLRYCRKTSERKRGETNMKSVVKVAVPVLCLLILIFCCYHHRQTEIVDKHISTYDSTEEQSESKTESQLSSSFGSSINQTSYVLNMSTKKFHYPYCSSVKQMADKNRRDMTATREEVIAIGYNPCGRCNP